VRLARRTSARTFAALPPLFACLSDRTPDSGDGATGVRDRRSRGSRQWLTSYMPMKTSTTRRERCNQAAPRSTNEDFGLELDFPAAFSIAIRLRTALGVLAMTLVAAVIRVRSLAPLPDEHRRADERQRDLELRPEPKPDAFAIADAWAQPPQSTWEPGARTGAMTTDRVTMTASCFSTAAFSSREAPVADSVEIDTRRACMTHDRLFQPDRVDGQRSHTRCRAAPRWSCPHRRRGWSDQFPGDG